MTISEEQKKWERDRYKAMWAVRLRLGGNDRDTGVLIPIACGCDGTDCEMIRGFRDFLAERGFDVLHVQQLDYEPWLEMREQMTGKQAKFLAWLGMMFKHAWVGERIRRKIEENMVVVGIDAAGDGGEVPVNKPPSDDPDNFKI